MDLELRSDVRELPVVEIAMLYTIISFLTVAKLSLITVKNWGCQSTYYFKFKALKCVKTTLL